MNASQDLATCGSCGLTWDDAIATTWTPAPSGRCPFEYFHVYDEDDECIGVEDVPADFPVRPVVV